MNGQSTTLGGSAKVERPDKPYPEFPLFPHASGGWMKKIRGKLWSFGGWRTDPKGEKALVEYYRQREHIEEYGERPADGVSSDVAKQTAEERKMTWPGLTVHYLVNHFLTATKREMLVNGKPGPRTFTDYKHVAKLLKEHLGENTRVADLKPDDFSRLAESLAKNGCGPVTRSNYAIRSRRIFKWAFEEDVMPSVPKFGIFKKVSSDVIDKHRDAQRREHGGKMFEAKQMKRLVRKASQPLKAMILLAANCGLGNTDVAELRSEHIDFETGWMNFPRPKTRKPRRAKLWPETIKAIREALAIRPEPASKEFADRFFLTPCGLPVVRTSDELKPIDEVSPEFRSLLDTLKLHHKGLGFYSIRHTYYTTATGCFDEKAVSLTMGHTVPGMGRHYTEFSADQWSTRLERVSQHVHAWLWPSKKCHD